MKKPLAIAVAALIAITSFAPSEASAGDRGGAVAAGVIGGLAIGALAGASIAHPNRAYVYDEYFVTRRPKVHVHRYYEAPYYPSHYYDPDVERHSEHDYVSGYHDGYRDASEEW